MTTKHTPGPWQVAGQTVSGYNRDAFICHCPKDREGYSLGLRRSEAEANARLIASAPELLATLKAAEDRMAVIIEADTDERRPEDAELVAVWQAAHAAIAKAEGR